VAHLERSAEEGLPFCKNRSLSHHDFMKSTFRRFVDRLRSAPWIWALLAIAVAVLIVFTKVLTLVLSLLMLVLVLNGLYHVILAVRNFLVRSFSVLVGGMRAIISGVLPG
jgi:hypothetical protein